MKTQRSFIFWSLTGFMVVANVAVFDYLVLSSAPEFRVQFTPDDAYYYLQLAKNYARLGYWTFDSGVSLASGFHPLLAYLLAAIYKVFRPSTEQFVTISLLLSSIPILVVIIFVWLKSILLRNTNFLVALSLFASTQSFLFNSVSGMEWSFVVLLAALYCLVFSYSGVSTTASLQLFAIGLFLSLARSDAGLLPCLVFLAALVFTLVRREASGCALQTSLAGLAGACSGIVVVFINNYIFTGNFIQSSARLKLYWSGLQEHLLPRSFLVAMRTAGFDVYVLPLSSLQLSLLFFIMLISLSLLIFKARKSVNDLWKVAPGAPQESTGPILYLASYLCVVAYVVIYTRAGGGVENWYTANFLVPMFILFAGLANFLTSRAAYRPAMLEVALSLMVLVTVFLNMHSVYPLADNAPWPHQQALLAAGKYLSDNPLAGKIASWNAGIIGYYQGGEVINIDGLVNEDIYLYTVQNNLPDYLKQQNILYLIDFETMLHPAYRKRGGYDDQDFVERLTPVSRFDQGQFPGWKYLTLYRIQD